MRIGDVVIIAALVVTLLATLIVCAQLQTVATFQQYVSRINVGKRGHNRCSCSRLNSHDTRHIFTCALSTQTWRVE